LLKLPDEKESVTVPVIQSYFIEPIWEQFCALLPQREVIPGPIVVAVSGALVLDALAPAAEELIRAGLGDWPVAELAALYLPLGGNVP